MDIGFVNSFFFQVSEIAIFNLHIQKKCLRLQLFLLFLTLYWVFEIGIINQIPIFFFYFGNFCVT